MTTTGKTQTGATGTTGTTLTIQPYLFLYGKAEEALDFYKGVFGGSYEIMRVKDSPMKDDASMGDGNRVMHASFTAPGLNFLCSDGRETKDVDPEEGNIALALNITDDSVADRVFDALSKGGDVKQPLKDAFWGGRFGYVVDRFGTDWMVNVQPQ